MRAHPWSLLALGLLFFPACGESVPCVECPDVAGTYDVTIEERGFEASSCGQLLFPGTTQAATLQQDGSQLRLLELEVNGTLHEDMSAFFEPYRLTVRGHSGTATWSGFFTPLEDGGVRLQGYLTLVRESDGCTISPPFTGVRR